MSARRVLFVTSNGTGLGHLTRSLAIARRIRDELEPFFITFSAAAPAVAELGFPVEYMASYDRPGSGNDIAWTLRTRERLRVAVRQLDPALVVFDGTHPYERLLPALRTSGAPLVWCRRGLWRDDADTSALHRTHLFDAVLEPGEVGEGALLGPTAERGGEARAVEPIVLLERSELAPREEAERALGLEPGRRNVLVQLGQGPGVREATARCLRALVARGDVQVAAFASALRDLGAEAPEGVVGLAPSYPLARHFAAFDAAVAAAGYNQVHELAALGVPALLVPMPRDTDDQASRAREAERAGLALAVSGPADTRMDGRLDELLGRAEELRAGLAARSEPRGAAQAAEWLAALVRQGRTPAGAEAGRAASAPLPLRARRAWIFARSVPRTALRIGRQVRARPPARVHVLALETPEGRLEELLAAELARLGEPPERVLVITDSLDFAPLLRAGVGFEHVPPRGSPQAEAAAIPYEAFLEERLALIRMQRRSPKRVVAWKCRADELRLTTDKPE